MKRSVFLKAAITIMSSMAMPFTTYARYRHSKKIDKGFLVNAGKDRFGKSISLFEGDIFDCKVSTKDTNGDIYVFESSRMKKGGPPLHFHYDQDEWWYVLQGEFLIKVGEETYHAKPGDSVFGPRKIPHAFAKIGEGEAKLLMFFQPAGKMEAHFKAIAEGVTKNMTEEELNNFRKAHGFEVVGPALGYLKK